MLLIQNTPLKQIRRSFRLAVSFFEPNVALVMGDLLDEGKRPGDSIGRIWKVCIWTGIDFHRSLRSTPRLTTTPTVVFSARIQDVRVQNTHADTPVREAKTVSYQFHTDNSTSHIWYSLCVHSLQSGRESRCGGLRSDKRANFTFWKRCHGLCHACPLLLTLMFVTCRKFLFKALPRLAACRSVHILSDKITCNLSRARIIRKQTRWLNCLNDGSLRCGSTPWVSTTSPFRSAHSCTILRLLHHHLADRFVPIPWLTPIFASRWLCMSRIRVMSKRSFMKRLSGGCCVVM